NRSRLARANRSSNGASVAESTNGNRTIRGCSNSSSSPCQKNFTSLSRRVFEGNDLNPLRERNMKKLIRHVLLALAILFSGLGAGLSSAQADPGVRTGPIGREVKTGPIRPSQTRPVSEVPASAGAPVSESKAKEIFNAMSAQVDITFENKWDGCWA